ncbi:hemagglutinin repeat-containing protein [Acinetobacter sp. C_3_1]|uniref:hemagglutinin repeat-containing protein n=1 Tax=unclassified Acinetobacter TaxID=196816 RepID=UPI003964770B
MKAAEIANSNGSTVIQTAGDVDVGTVNVGRTTHIQSDAQNFNHSSYRTDVGSQIAGQGDIYLTGQNIQITGSNISSVTGTAALSAQHNLTISEGRTEQKVEARNIETGGSAFSKKTSNSYFKTQRNEALASSIDGNKVILDGNNVSIRGSNVISDDLTQIQAKENISIKAAENQSSEVSESTVKKSGFTASVSDGVASVGYGKSNVHSKDAAQSTDLTQSVVSSLAGDVNIVAGKDLTAEAAQLSAAKDMNLQGANVHLNALNISQEQQSQFDSKQSGISVGITYSAEAAAASSVKKSKENNDFSDSAVGKIMSSAETARKATMSATTPVVITASHQKINNSSQSTSTQSVGTEVTAGGNLNIIARDGDIRSQGAKISAEGNALLHAKNNIDLLAVSNTESQSADTKRSGFSIDTRDHLAPIGVYNDKGVGNGSLSQSVGTELSVGGKTVLQTEVGDINIIGSKVVSQNDLSLSAGRDINIQSAQSTQNQSESQKGKGWGSAQISDTERFDGYMANQNNSSSVSMTQERSQLGSLDGNVNIAAGNNDNQKVADVVAGKDINITAKNISIVDDQNTGSDSQSSKDLKVGVFSRITSPLIDLINAVDNAGKSKADDRTQALQGVAAAAQGYQTYSDIQGGALFKAETGIGFSTSKNSQDKSYSASQSNLLNAGGNINLTSTAGDIHLKNTQVKAKDTISLDSAKDILLESGQSQQKADGKNSNAGAQVGVGVSVGAQTGVYVYAEAGYGKGSNHLESTTHNNTALNANQISIKSKGDITLKGAQARANRIDADVGGKLNIISQQDTLAQDSEQTGAGIRLQASLGTAWQASGNYSNSNASGDYASVNQQTGLFAGDGGYHVKADSVDLQGGAITSTASKENNDLTANSLSFSNIENHSGYKATSVALSGGTQLGQADGKSPAPQPTSNSNWKDSKSFSPSLPQQDKDKDSSITYATISAGNINIGGKATTVEQLGIHSDAATASRTLETLPNLQAILDKQKTVADATSTIAAASRTYAQDQVKQAVSEKEAIGKQLASQLSPEEQAKLEKMPVAEKDSYLAQNAAYASALANEKAVTQQWGMGGDKSRALNAVTMAVTGALGGQTDLQVAANALAPYAANVIGEKFGHGEDKNTAAQLVSHAILGATLAYINGGDPTAGGSAAVASEAAANYLTNQLAEKYKDDPKYFVNGEFQANLLSEAEKAQIRDLTAGIGAVIGGAAGDSSYNAQLAGVIGQNAVENNEMNIPFPVNPDRMSSAQSLIKYGVNQGWSNEKIQEEVNKTLRGKGVEISNENIVEVLDKTGKVATIIGIYPSPYTKPIGAVGGALGTASILVDNKKTGKQKVFEIFGSSLGSFGSGRALKNVPVSEGVKNAHSTISGEIGGKAGEAMYQCIQNPKQAGC